MTHKMISVPDPQVLEMEALDRAFGDWCLEHEESMAEDVEYLQEEWASIDRNALVFTASDMEDHYDPEFDSFDPVELAMDKDMYERIQAKRQIIYRINQGDEFLD